MTQLQNSILLIDDEPQIRKFLRISLNAQGYRVLEAGTGEEGLAQAALNRPDLVVLDLGLPDRDGQDILRDLREWSQVPVLVLSVRASEGEKVLALDGGANDYVTKPFGIQEFLARVRVLLRQAAQGESPEAAVAVGPLQVDFAYRRVTPEGAGGADAQGVRGARRAGTPSRTGSDPAATAQGYLGPDPRRRHPLPAGRGRPPAAETRRRSGQPALPGDRGGRRLSPARQLTRSAILREGHASRAFIAYDAAHSRWPGCAGSAPRCHDEGHHAATVERDSR